MSRTRLRSGVLAVGLAGAMLLVAVAPSAALAAQGETPPVGRAGEAEPSLENDEVVLATLDPSGLPEEAVLLSRVLVTSSADGGGPARTVEDPASTVNVVYRDRRGTPGTGDGVVLLALGDGRTEAVTQAAFDQPLPVAVHAEYRLDDAVVPAADVPGAQGELDIRYTVTNTTAETQTLRWRDADGTRREREVPVFVPFAGSMTLVLPPGLDLVSAPGAVQSTDRDGRTVLQYRLQLAPPLGQFQTQLDVALRSRDGGPGGATPQLALEVAPTTSEGDPVVGFTASALAGTVEGNAELVDGLGELSDGLGELGQGAEALAEGNAELAGGAAILAEQIGGPVRAGGDALATGAEELARGVDELAAGLQGAGAPAQELADGAEDLSRGLRRLSAGLGELAGPDGLGQAGDAARQLRRAAAAIADAVGSPQDPPWPGLGTSTPATWEAFLTAVVGTIPDDALPGGITPDDLADALASVPDEVWDNEVLDRLDPPPLPDLSGLLDPDAGIDLPTLVQALRLLTDVSGALADVGRTLTATTAAQLELLGQAKRQAGRAGRGALAATVQAEALYRQLCLPSPSITQAQCESLADVVDDAAAAAAAAGNAATLLVTAKAAQLVQALLALVLTGGVQGLQAALDLLTDQVETLAVAIRSGDLQEPGLVEGLRLLQDALALAEQGAEELVEGSEAAVGGSRSLARGVGELADALAAAGDGSRSLVDGADEFSDAAAAAAGGISDLAEGAGSLATGAAAAAAGADGVAEGVVAAQEQGVDEVAASLVAASAEPALAEAWLIATDARAVDALPYGPPEDAIGYASYRFTMAATTPSSPSGWAWALFGATGLAVLLGLGLRRTRLGQ